jgi:hypothetical protein
VKTSVAGLLATLLVASCGRGAAPGRPDGEAKAEADADDAGPEERDPRALELWTRAREGDADDLARLYDLEGDTGLIELGALPAYRITALQALGFARDYVALPWLSEIAGSGTDTEAEAALESARSIAAWPRAARDPDDALELRAGCDSLLALATAQDKAPSRRAHAASVLRMLAPLGCASADAADRDAK